MTRWTIRTTQTTLRIMPQGRNQVVGMLAFRQCLEDSRKRTPCGDMYSVLMLHNLVNPVLSVFGCHVCKSNLYPYTHNLSHPHLLLSLQVCFRNSSNTSSFAMQKGHRTTEHIRPKFLQTTIANHYIRLIPGNFLLQKS